MINEFLNYKVREEGMNSKTERSYRNCLKEMGQCIFGTTEYYKEDVLKLTRNDYVSRWLNVVKIEGGKDKKGLSSSSLNVRIACLTSLYSYLDGDSIEPVRNIGSMIPKFKTERVREENIIDEGKAQKLLAFSDLQCEDDYLSIRNAFITYLITATGTRLSELRALNIGDVQSDGKIVLSKGVKRDKMRTVYVPETIMNKYYIYLSYREQINTEDNALFLSSRKTRLSDTQARRIVNSLGINAGVEKVRPHELRKCFTTMMVENSSAETAQKLVGHVNINTTLGIYYKPQDTTLKDAANSNPLFKK